jgi:probable F420-dependent oxidoreductase
MRPFRFSFNIFGISSREDFVTECRDGEELGYDAVFSADHLGMAAPFPTLIAAAEATQRMRVGTLVVNVPFWNPALLAREAATADILTGGRLIVGLGAGHMKWEFDQAGIGWQSFGARAQALEAAITGMRRYFAGELDLPPGARPLPQPVQRSGFDGTGPPLLVGGTGDRVLRIAGQYAQIIGVAGAYQVKGQPPGTFRLATAAEADDRVLVARQAAGSRADDIEWHLLVQAVVVTDDRRAAAGELLAGFRQAAEQAAEQAGVSGEGVVMSLDEALQTPYLLIGSADEIAEQLRAARRRWGFSFVTVHEPYMRTFAPVIERLRGQ